MGVCICLRLFEGELFVFVFVFFKLIIVPYYIIVDCFSFNPVDAKSCRCIRTEMYVFTISVRAWDHVQAPFRLRVHHSFDGQAERLFRLILSLPLWVTRCNRADLL